MVTRYVPIGPLGFGGMGRVDLALAEDAQGLARLVVLKRLRIDAAGDARTEHASALRWEAHLSALLAHPNVAATLALDLIDGEIAMVTEYLEGPTLRELFEHAVRNGTRIPRPIVLRIARDALAGLAYAHDLRDSGGAPLGIVHRDVSPANLLVTSCGVTKLLDFGVAKAKGAVDAPAGFVKGKVRYMAPEQIVGGAVDARADVYAVGVLLWEALTGARFGGADVEHLLARRAFEDAPRARGSAPDVPSVLDTIVARCLERSSERRFASARELVDVLDRNAASFGGVAERSAVGAYVAGAFGGALARRRELIAYAYETVGRHRGAPGAVEAWDDARQVELAPLGRRRRALGIASAVLVFLFVGAAAAHRGRLDHASAAPGARRAESAGARIDPTPRRKLEARAGDAPASARPRPRTRETKRPGSMTPEATTPAADRPTRLVTLDAYPWADVVIDDESRGTTPIVKDALTLGTHHVVLTNAEKRLRSERTIRVTEGGDATFRFTLE